MGYSSRKGHTKKIGLLPILLLSFYWVTAAIQPADRAVLNHTQVMFAWNEHIGADSYQLLVNGDGVKQIMPVRSLAYLLKTGLRFGQAYQWQYTALKKGKVVYTSPLFTFSIAGSILVADDHFRYNIRQKKAGAYANNLIFLDHLGVAVNREGEPVWYLPFDSIAYGIVPKYRNLQITPDGSVTYLRGDECWEKNLAGETLWEAPDNGVVSKSATEFYHHDFIKNADGSYRVCSYQFVDMPNLQQPTVTSRVRYNTVVQYDATGKVIWQWNEKDHSTLTEIFEDSAPGETEIAGTHMNGFSCYEKAGVCIFSFRNNSTLQVIEEATGKVLYTLEGERPAPGGIAFAAQHSPVFMPNGDVLVYNNNVPNNKSTLVKKPSFPTVLQLRFSKNYQSVQKVWEYECRLADYPDGWAGKEGYADLLPNNHVLVCIGGANKIIEVDRNKKIVWEMDMVAFDEKKKGWLPFSNYRSHFASSLYPNYFTVQQTSGVGLVKKGQTIRIKINNDGTDTASYKVELFSSDVLAPYHQTIQLKPGTSKELPIILKPGKAITKAGEVHFAIVRVTPVNDPDGPKNLEYRIGMDN